MRSQPALRRRLNPLMQAIQKRGGDAQSLSARRQSERLARRKRAVLRAVLRAPPRPKNYGGKNRAPKKSTLGDARAAALEKFCSAKK
jgi:hypothetical protein